MSESLEGQGQIHSYFFSSLAAAWIVLGIFSLIRLQADYLLVIGVCVSLSIANIIGFTKCKKDAKKNFQDIAQSALLSSSMRSTLQSAFGV